MNKMRSSQIRICQLHRQIILTEDKNLFSNIAPENMNADKGHRVLYVLCHVFIVEYGCNDIINIQQPSVQRNQ